MRRGAVAIPADFAQPHDMAPHNAEVFNGVYDAGVDFEAAPVVLDIGACCGAFAMWATQRWPGCRVESFEPNPAAQEYLMRNNPRGSAYWGVRGVGVRAIAGRYALYDGKHNLGEASMHDIGEQQTDGALFVDCVAASSLPVCDVLKVDTEGCEPEIVFNYVEHVYLPRVIALEWHRERDFQLLQLGLLSKGYQLVRGRIECAERGTAVWVLRDGGRR